MAKDRSTRRDQAGFGPDPDVRGRLVPLDELEGYDLRDGEPDIRGWDVTTLSGRDAGEVGDLLVDPERGEVVMLEVELRGDGVHTEVPIRSVQLDRSRKAVIIDSGDLDDIVRHDVRARDRYGDAERERLRASGATPRPVGYAERDDRLTDPEVDPDAAAAREREPLRREAQQRHDRDRDHDPEGELLPDSEEVVVERRPVIEELVVRRRVVEE